MARLGDGDLEVQSACDQRRKGLTTAEKACMKRYPFATASQDIIGKLATKSGSTLRRRGKKGTTSSFDGPAAAPEPGLRDGDPLAEMERQYGQIVEKLLPLPVHAPAPRSRSRNGGRPSSRPVPGSRGRARVGVSFCVDGPGGSPTAACSSTARPPPPGFASASPKCGTAAAAAAPASEGYMPRLCTRPLRWDPEQDDLTQNVIRLVKGASANKIERDVGGKIKFIHSSNVALDEEDLDPDCPTSKLAMQSTSKEKSYTVAKGLQELQGHPLHQFRRRMFKVYSSGIAAFDAINIDGNKELDMREWCDVIARWGLCSMFEARVIFELMDANRDGSLTLHEFQMGLEAVAPVTTLMGVRKRLICLGFQSMLQALSQMDGGGEDTSHVPLGFHDFAAALRRAYIIEDREHRAIFNLVRDPNDPLRRAALTDLAAGLAAVSPCMLITEARQQLVAKWGSLSNAYQHVEDAWLDSSAAFEKHGAVWLGMSRAEAAKIFRFTDLDRSGSLTLAELKGVFNLSAQSIFLEDIRRRVQQSYRGIEAALRDGLGQNGEELDDCLRFTEQELCELLEPVVAAMGKVETRKLVRLMISTTEEEGITLNEFFRGVRLFAPTCCLEALRLQLGANSDRICDAFREVPNRRRPMRQDELFDLLTSLGIRTVDFTTCFDLIDVRSAGCITLTEFMAALQGSQTGTRRWIGQKEREEIVQSTVREEFAAVRGNLNDLKSGLRRGLFAPKPLAATRKPPKDALKESTSGFGGGLGGTGGGLGGTGGGFGGTGGLQKRNSGTELRLLVSPLGATMGPAARRRCIQRAADRVTPRSSVAAADSPLSSGAGGFDKDLRTTSMRKSFQKMSASMKSWPEQDAELGEQALSSIKDYFVSQKEVLTTQEPILSKHYSKAGFHQELTHLRQLERQAGLRRAGLSMLGQSASAPFLSTLRASPEPPETPPTGAEGSGDGLGLGGSDAAADAMGGTASGSFCGGAARGGATRQRANITFAERGAESPSMMRQPSMRQSLKDMKAALSDALLSPAGGRPAG